MIGGSEFDWGTRPIGKYDWRIARENSRDGVRGILGVLSFPGQAGYPAPMNTEACLGYSTMGYQSAELAIQSCDAQRRLPVRRVGKATRGHGAGQKELAQRAEVGFRLCCATLSPAAVPPTYCLGPLDPLKARGTRLWGKIGPWAEGD